MLVPTCTGSLQTPGIVPPSLSWTMTSAVQGHSTGTENRPKPKFDFSRLAQSATQCEEGSTRVEGQGSPGVMRPGAGGTVPSSGDMDPAALQHWHRLMTLPMPQLQQ